MDDDALREDRPGWASRAAAHTAASVVRLRRLAIGLVAGALGCLCCASGALAGAPTTSVDLYANIASIAGTPPSGLSLALVHASNEVLVDVPTETYEVIDQQRFAGEASFTTAKLTGKPRATVEYEILVKNTGERTLHVEGLVDADCTTPPAGPANAELAPGEEDAEYTCSRELTTGGVYPNVATVIANGTERPSDEVVAELEKQTAFEVITQQRLAGETAYTTAKLTGKPRATVEYEILVKNTGETRLHVEGLVDADCTTPPAGPAKAKLAPGEEDAEYTCSRELADAGIYTNSSVVTGSRIETISNEVEVELIAPSVAITVEEEQRLAGQAAYTQAKLTASVGASVEYFITVTDTGQTVVTLANIKDANCANMSGPSKTELAPGEWATYLCEHKLLETGALVNTAEVEAAEQLTSRSNPVEVEALTSQPAPVQSYEIVEQQKVGLQTEYTKQALSATIGETVDYRLTVTNSGEHPETFSDLSDANCTNIKGGPSGALGAGASASWTCERVLPAPGEYANVATVMGNAEAKRSNQVVATVPEPAAAPKQAVKALCTISESANVLHGASGEKRTPFTVRIGSLGIKQIRFYLDGREFTELWAYQARHGWFAVKIDPRKLSYGVHRLSIKTVMKDPVCAEIARTAVFVYPHVSRSAS